MTTLSTHVLDAALGRPASGLAVRLLDAERRDLAHGVTDADGRLRFADPIGTGTHRLILATGPWFAASDRATLFPEVELVFEVSDDQPHYHVALLLSPFAYTTYRGS